MRRRLKKDERRITHSEWGAGSQKLSSQLVRVRDLVGISSCGTRKGEFLFRLSAWYKPARILELGTQLGISTAYLAAGRPGARLLSLEGHLPYAEWAQQNLNHLGLSHVEIIHSPFEEWIPRQAAHLAPIDFVYLDGDHRQERVLQNIRTLRTALSPNALVVVDDINWSEGMQNAWAEMKALPEVSLSIDLFDMGLLFFQEGRREKEHYCLVPFAWKPWRLGFFPRLPTIQT